MPETKRARRTRALQLATVFFLLFLLIFLLGTESVRAATGVGRETVRSETFVRSLSGTGTLFLSETAVINRHNNGAVEYAVKDGARVDAGALLAKVYRDDTGTDGRARAAALYDEIELLSAALSGADGGERWEYTYLRAYAAYTRAGSAGDSTAAENAAQTLRYLLLCRKGAENAPLLEARVAELRAELAAMLQFAGEPDTVLSPIGGTFYRTTDGYESVLLPEAAAGLTPEGLQALLAGKPETPAGEPEPLGKLTLSGRFAVAVQTSAEMAVFFKEGDLYPVLFENEGVTVDMTLVSARASAGGEAALLVFSADECPLQGGSARRRQVRIDLETVTGLSIPERAMRTQNNRDGVFVLVNGRAEWRQVRILYRADGCCIVAPAGSETAEGEPPAPAAGDIVLVTSRGLYEGKEIP